ncbi:MAG: hypothetical protein ACK47M_22265 [Caldilinea sp.]
MSTRKPTPDILDDVLGADNVAETDVEIPVFQTTSQTPKTRPTRSKAQLTPEPAPEPTPPIPVIVKPVEWEYREVIVRDYRGWRVRFVDGRERSNWKNGPTLREYLEQVGKEGWELVSLSERYHNQKTAYFKRVKHP